MRSPTGNLNHFGVGMQITDGKVHESERAGSYSFSKGTVEVVDRGLCGLQLARGFGMQRLLFCYQE
ncbi:hypothetical protein [Sphingobacterium sp. IITKGP-BTPF85]|uniref:hypothetical protein n=1 Tax=Sphingobacterium sp. IITKGP-BTPF85 TaxID=1338009 RepID=UPI000389DE11|nr:hypothetical protein [Sphingobacterium sp. IITKGP-BTPF85]KKX49306.1 hypothetical protein L950_0216085 [Sphingobacterium sp. IITKGP-BTPF85]CDT30042.1 hypothetical protein BN1088_70005 [Sphingobacterium sp. PM2-P1-29]